MLLKLFELPKKNINGNGWHGLKLQNGSVWKSDFVDMYVWCGDVDTEGNRMIIK